MDGLKALTPTELVEKMKVHGGYISLESYIKDNGGKKFIKLLGRLPKLDKSKLRDGMTGIYFLTMNNEIVYVGQTKNLKLRLPQHENTKNYNGVRFIGDVPHGLLDYLEGYYINKANPKYNVNKPFYEVCL